MEFTLLFAAAIGVGAGAVALRWEAARGNAADCTRDLWDVLVSATVVGLFAGRIAAMIGAGTNPLSNLGDILIIRGGVATGPAAVAAIATVAVVTRREVVVVADALAVAALAALGGWHAGCLVREACLGEATDLPWAMSQGGSSVGRHPVELYAAAMLLLTAIVLARFRTRGLPPLVAAGSALAAAALTRLLTEPFRLSLGGGPVWWYWFGVVVGTGAVVVGIARRRRRATASASA